MQYSDGYKENTYLTWKGEKYRVTPEFESLSFYDERDGDVSLYCISLTDDWHKEERYPCWDTFCGIDGPLSEILVEQWICDYESQSGGLEYGDGRFEHYGWNSQDNANYENFILALIRFEESLDDKEVLDKSYAEYMKNDFIRLLNNEFDYMIDELRKSG